MDDLQVRLAAPADAAQIVTLFCGGFRPQVAQLLIYGCSGAPEYIRMQLAPVVPHAESAFYVAQAAEHVVGAVEMRKQPESLFLNYIVVDPGHRGHGIGAVLLSTAVRMSGVCTGRIELDVLQDNARALSWYGRLGFATRASTDFVELAPPSREQDERVYVAGLPQADVCHERFGFSTFQLHTRTGVVTVGRIGEAWFRLTDPATVRNPSVFAALSRLDSRRRIFGVLPAASTPAAQIVRILAKTHRMDVEIPRLMAVLSHDHEKSGEPV
jgi:GNAT superfamily N-acetyltransferase